MLGLKLTLTETDIYRNNCQNMMEGQALIVEDMKKVIEKGLAQGCKFVDVRFQEHKYQHILVENGVLKDLSTRKTSGVGLRVLYRDCWGFASTDDTSYSELEKALSTAISIARASSEKAKKGELAEYKYRKVKASSKYKVDPFKVEEEEKVKLALEVNKASLEVEDVKNAITRLGFERDYRIYVNSEGGEVEVTCFLVGIGHMTTARVKGSMERVWDSESKVSGYEFITSRDWREYAIEISNLAVEAANSAVPSAGTYPVIVDSEVIGLLLHEAFGHASEGDLVESGNSVLRGKLGDKVASELVTIVDEGVVEGGYYFPYDDEGVEKKKTIIVEDGILKSYINSRQTAVKLKGEPTGNSRAQDYKNIPIVRQTNYYMEPRDYKFEELIEDIEFGYYIRGRGSTGGEVNPGMGTFTFSVGPSKVIKNGELAETVRGVSISGMILETLKEVDGVGKDLKVRTSVFGGCGKLGQMVRVGVGGPHVRVRKMVVGGRL